MPFIPTKSHNACPRHGPWATSQTATTCTGAKRVPDAIVGAGQQRETTSTEKHWSPRNAGGGVGRGADNPTSDKKVVTKSKAVKTGPICQGRG